MSNKLNKLTFNQILIFSSAAKVDVSITSFATSIGERVEKTSARVFLVLKALKSCFK